MVISPGRGALPDYQFVLAMIRVSIIINTELTEDFLNQEIIMELQKQSISLARLVFSASFTFLLGSSAALATTMSPLESSISPTLNPKWTGFYVGAGAGMGAWTGNSKVTVNGIAITATQMQGGYGGFATLIGGYDYYFIQPSVVVGGFIDGSLGHISGSAEFPGVVGNLYENANWDIGARLGPVINSIILPYVSIGYSRAYFSKTKLNLALPTQPGSGLTTPSFDVGGWFWGAGLEAKITSHWSIKGEYRYAAYNRDTLPLNALIAGLPVNAFMPFKPIVQTFQAEVIYKI